MKSLQHHIDHMNELLNELIHVATQLRDMSLQVISEEDLAPLQKYQEDLLTQLENVDQQIQENYRHQMGPTTQDWFHKQLQTFQHLNQEYIQNLNASHGLIQFDLHRLQDEDDKDFSPLLSRLKKSSPPLDKSDSTDTEENEEEE